MPDPQNLIELSIAEQKMLGNPLTDPTGYAPEDQAFLQLILEKVEKGEINLFQPSSIINQLLYNSLSGAAQSKTEFQAVNLLAKIREIYALYKANPEPTFQLKNLVASVRNIKEHMEKADGDLFII